MVHENKGDPSSFDKGGPSLFFFFGKFYLLKFFFFGPKGGSGWLRPLPRFVPSHEAKLIRILHMSQAPFKDEIYW